SNRTIGTTNAGSAAEGIEGFWYRDVATSLKPKPNMPASSVPPFGTLGKFSSIKRSESGSIGFSLAFETVILIVILSSCLAYVHETRPQRYRRSTFSAVL